MKEPDAPGAAEDQSKDSKGRSVRKLAEWVSLGISAVLILGLAGFLLVEAFRANEPFVPVEVQAKADETRQLNGRFILPVQITNRGEQTLRDLKIELSFTSPEGEPEKTDLLIDYLGERSEQTAYFFLKQDPRTLKLEVEPVSYRVE